MSATGLMLPFFCPGCSIMLEPSPHSYVRCARCDWTGQAYCFSPRVQEIEAAKSALPEDASCIHHPRKKADAVCAGTGDYICSLCAVEVNGQTYSAEYLNGPGKNLAGQAFERSLPRPDSQIMLYLLCCFIPYVNFVFVVFGFIWIPHAVFLYFKTLRLRRENELYSRVVGMGRVITLPILLGIFALSWVGGVVAIVIALLQPGGLFYGR